MSNSMEVFFGNVEYLRSQKNWTLMKTAEKANMSFSTLNSAKYGNCQSMKLINIEKLASGFGISVSDILSESMIERMRQEEILRKSYIEALEELKSLEKNIEELKKSLQNTLATMQKNSY